MSEPLVIETQQVLITEPELVSVTLDREDIAVVSVGEQGPQGPQGIRGEKGEKGDQGPTDVGGLPVEFTNPTFGDVLTIGTNKIVNSQASSITDGGNF